MKTYYYITQTHRQHWLCSLFQNQQSVHLKQMFAVLFVILMMCLLGIFVLVFWSNLNSKIVNIIKNFVIQIGLYKNEIFEPYKKVDTILVNTSV